MKHTTILALLFTGALMTSCFKKDRTCECTDYVISETSTEPGYVFEPQPATTSSQTYKKVKKNNVLVTTCVTTESTYSYQNQYYDPATQQFRTSIVTRTTKSDCKIK
ncbi:MAG: hypothetical protein V4635_14685 [Bacteroidota bacterium]